MSKRAHFLAAIREQAAYPRWSLPQPCGEMLVHLHRPCPTPAGQLPVGQHGRISQEGHPGPGGAGLWRATPSELARGCAGEFLLAVERGLGLLVAGEHLAVVVGEQGSERRRVLLVGGDGRAPRELARGLSPFCAPALSPDGELLVCAEPAAGQRRAVLCGVDASMPGLLLVERDARSTRLFEARLRGGIVEPCGEPLLCLEAPRRLLTAGGLLVDAGDHLLDPVRALSWELPEGTLLGAVRPFVAPGAGRGEPLVALSHAGEVAIHRLAGDGGPARQLWRSGLGTRLEGLGCAGPGVWALTASIEQPSRLLLVTPKEEPARPGPSRPVGSRTEGCQRRHGEGTGQVRLVHHHRHRAVSLDGTPVPFVVTELERAGHRSAPALVSVYGGFGVPHWPEAEPTVLPWLRCGGRWVTAQVRGGGEYGPGWHAAGSGEDKHRAVDDLLAVVIELAHRGWATPGQIVLCGASHGGLVALLAALQDPTLIGGLCVTAPLLDIADLDAHGNGAFWRREFPERARDRTQLSPARLVGCSRAPLPPLWLASMGRDERVGGDPAAFVELWRRRGLASHRREAGQAHVGASLEVLDERAAELLAAAWAMATAAAEAPPACSGGADVGRCGREVS